MAEKAPPTHKSQDGAIVGYTETAVESIVGAFHVPSAFTHAVTALSMGTCFSRKQIPKRAFVAAALCSAIPDLDVIGFRFGVKYGDFWGHRGFTHSILFAALLAGVVTLVFFREGKDQLSRFALGGYLFAATASHGLLDAMTNGGLGVAFFSPLDTTRYFFPWRPIRVAPIGTSRFFTARGFTILKSEMLWVWIPAVSFAVLVLMFYRKRSARYAEND